MPLYPATADTHDYLGQIKQQKEYILRLEAKIDRVRAELAQLTVQTDALKDRARHREDTPGTPSPVGDQREVLGRDLVMRRISAILDGEEQS
jgi:hypothetical protein